MKFYGRSQEIAQTIINRFKAGQIAEPLATVYLNRDGDQPMWNWSINNILLCLFSGCTDARGFRQWKEAGRNVKKGEKANTFIMIPLVKKEDDNGEEQSRCYGFKTAAVFDIVQTEGAPLAEEEHPHRTMLDTLPLVEIAHHWEIQIETFNGETAPMKGQYSRTTAGNEMILLGVENPNTFLHELIHAADQRASNLAGDKLLKEAVAQLGASTLAHMIGRPDIADEGKTWHYIAHYAEEKEVNTLTACTRALDRITAAIEVITTAAEEMS